MECVLAVPKRLGPWGRETPPNWKFELRPWETIEGVIIQEDWIVDGIGFIIVDNDGLTTTKYFGGSRGNRHEITLNRDEFITHISGAFGQYSPNGGQIQIASITIHTNYNPAGYGPYGKGTGVSNLRQFSSIEPLAGYVAAGFFGSANEYLDSIGFDISEIKDRGMTYGPWGSQSTPNWNFKLSPRETIKGVIIRDDWIVDGIGFIVVDNRGNTTSKYFGGPGGSRHEITLNPDEFITQISGAYGTISPSGGQIQITSIKIHTNCNLDGYGPYGKGKGVSNVFPFSTTEPPVGYAAVGFFGSAGKFLESIGVSVSKVNDPVIKYGAWGSQSPPNWNFKLSPGETIKGVIVQDEWIVDGIGFIVVDNRGNTTTKYFGGPGGTRREITLNPDEFITHISGAYGEYSPAGGQTQIASIKFHTNRNPDGYGPYGKEKDVSNIRQFSSAEPLAGYVVVGFFGSTGTYLDSIGVFFSECGH